MPHYKRQKGSTKHTHRCPGCGTIWNHIARGCKRMAELECACARVNSWRRPTDAA